MRHYLMSRLNVALVTCVFAGLTAIPVTYGAPIYASMDVTAFAQVGNDTSTVPAHDAWYTVPRPLSVSSTATVDDSPNGRVTAHVTGMASWAPDGNSGTVTFRDVGWSAIPSASSAESATLNFNSGDDWAYFFTADASGELGLTYSVSLVSGNGFGLWGWRIDLVDWTTGSVESVPWSNPYDPTTSGIFTAVLTAGDEYSLALKDGADTYGVVNDGIMQGDFAFTLPVPEPATIAVLGSAFVGLVALRRRHKATFATLGARLRGGDDKESWESFAWFVPPVRPSASKSCSRMPRRFG